MRIIVAVSSAILGVSLLSFPVVAQQKTVKACQEEWRANKDANQAKGITQKAYVTQCRAGGSAHDRRPRPREATGKAEKKASQKKTAAPAAPAAASRKQLRRAGTNGEPTRLTIRRRELPRRLTYAVPCGWNGRGACARSGTCASTGSRADANDDGSCAGSSPRHRRLRHPGPPRRRRPVRTSTQRKGRPGCDV